MNKKNSIKKPNNIFGFIFAIIGVVLLKLFLDERIIDIPKGTSKGAIITIIGYGTIVIIILFIAVVIQFLITKFYKKK
jgi:hypothetical protein